MATQEAVVNTAVPEGVLELAITYVALRKVLSPGEEVVLEQSTTPEKITGKAISVKKSKDEEGVIVLTLTESDNAPKEADKEGWENMPVTMLPDGIMLAALIQAMVDKGIQEVKFPIAEVENFIREGGKSLASLKVNLQKVSLKMV